MTDTEILEAVSSLVSDNEEYRKLWAREHKVTIANLQEDKGEIEDCNYMVVRVFATSYLQDGSWCRLGARLFKEHIHTVFPCDTLERAVHCLSWQLCLFPTFAYVVMKKGEDGIFREIDYKSGYEVNGEITEFKGNCLILPIEKDSKVWVEIEGIKESHKLAKEYMDLFKMKRKYKRGSSK